MQIILNSEYFLVVLNLQGGLNIKLIESGSVNEITSFGDAYILLASTSRRAGVKQNTFGQNRTLKVVLSLKESHSFK